jgi:hypothetical protein
VRFTWNASSDPVEDSTVTYSVGIFFADQARWIGGRTGTELLIPREKLTAYLLVPQTKNDKSRFLAQAGFTQANPDALEAAIITRSLV